MKEDNRKERLIEKSGAKIDTNMRDYGNDPFFIKKANESKEFLDKHGFPDELKRILNSRRLR